MKILFYVEPENSFTVFRVLRIKGNRKNSMWTNDIEKVYISGLLLWNKNKHPKIKQI